MRRRVYGVFEGMHGLRLSRRQAERLFALRADVCGRVRTEPMPAFDAELHEPVRAVSLVVLAEERSAPSNLVPRGGNRPG